MKIFSCIALCSLSLVLAQNATYPVSGKVPTPKPEWLELIKGANITAAPVLKSNGNNGPSTSGEDKYCDWAKSGCTGNSLYQCPKGQWGLTFDDGPSEFSPSLYDFLKSTNQKATLFMIGANVVKHPEIVKRAYEEGHEIAMHTWSHPYMTTLTNEQVVAELKWTEQAIRDIIGVSPKLFRPPYGDIDNRVRDIGDALGFTSVIWDHDTNDWMLAENAPGFKSEYIDGNFTKWIKEANSSSTGGLSLEHDITQVTINAAIKNLPGLQKAYKVVTVGQCNGVPSYKDANTTITNNTAVASISASSAVSSASSSVSIVTPPTSASASSKVGSAQASSNPTSAGTTITSSYLFLFMILIASLG
ncbi:hypothetical protein BY458DRAFT_531115 [Sporodiniella umbellata]|nr:hypothetical protein BY458DRAFT_531115 [Sporodiniella umbellata]